MGLMAIHCNSRFQEAESELILCSWLNKPFFIFLFKTKIEKGTPFNRSITKSIEQTSKFTEANAESRTKNIPVACLRQLFRLILRQN